MFGQKFKDISWTNLGNVGSLWELTSFEKKEVPSWENFLAKEREYWGADEPDQKRMKHHFGNEKPEEKLLEKSKKGYNDFLGHLLHWNGLCKINEVVQVLTIQSSVLVLSKNWKGEVSVHSDLEIWLKEELKYFVLDKDIVVKFIVLVLYFCLKIVLKQN